VWACPDIATPEEELGGRIQNSTPATGQRRRIDNVSVMCSRALAEGAFTVKPAK